MQPFVGDGGRDRESAKDNPKGDEDGVYCDVVVAGGGGGSASTGAGTGAGGYCCAKGLL